MLSLLTQALAAAWALAPAATDAAATATETVMPCHGATADAAAQPSAAASVPASMACCDDGDCGHCSAGCLSTPGLWASLPTNAAPVAETLRARRGTAPRPHAAPHELLRPPIDLTC
ncbi:hypothetical protein [Sinimarinibacterium thermocellulolyticum]|uniref:Secreted protein n=1 Tax=Sinimarinibacterium thermocellulolyticum TaxID=3170016 RepID=A0ABV2AA05_9GAMM